MNGMNAHRRIMMLCPGCESWQLEYDVDTISAFVTWHSVDGDPLAFTPNLSEFYQAIDDAVQEHSYECPNLAEIVRTANLAAKAPLN